MAAPFVTGLAAYLLAYAPDLAPDQVKTIIEESADKIGGATGYSSDFGNGRVNVNEALALATGSSVPASGSVYGTGSLIVTLTTGGTDSTMDQEVSLYDSSGNFIETGYTGDSSYSAATGLDDSGTVKFQLLKPGSYTAKVTIGGTVYSGTADQGSSGDASMVIAIP